MSDLWTSSLSFVSLSCSRIVDKLAINWQNFVRVRLQLKFAFIIWSYISTMQEVNIAYLIVCDWVPLQAVDI